MNNDMQQVQDKIDEIQSQIDELELDKDRFDKSDYLSEYDYKLQFEHLTVEIMGTTYEQLKVLEEIDETAFNEGYNNWVDGHDLMDIAEYEDIFNQIEELEDELNELGAELEDLKE